MVELSFTGYDFPDVNKYEIAKYNHKRIGENEILVTNFHGGWIVLSDDNFKDLQLEKIHKNPELFKELSDAGIILTKDNESKIVNNFKNKYRHLERATNLHIISVTLRCNHNCIYCHAKSKGVKQKGYDMTEETAKKVVDFIFQTPESHISIEFQGGEPLLNFGIVKFIIEYSKELNKKAKKCINFCIVTNLSLMTREIFEYLRKNNVGLNTSLDGPKELHNKNRKYIGGSSYDQVVKWIEIMRKEYGYQISALQTTTKFSLPFYKEIVDEFIKNGMLLVRARSLNNTGFANKLWSDIGYTPEEFLNYWKNMLEYILELNKKGIKIREGMTVLIGRILLTNKQINYTCWGIPCGCGISQIGYEYDGTIYSCDESRSFDMFKLGTVDQTFKEVLSGPNMMGIMDINSGLYTKCGDCVWRPFCGPCIVCTYGQQGKLIGNMSIDNECIVKSSMLEHVLKKISKPGKDKDIILGWLFDNRVY